MHGRGLGEYGRVTTRGQDPITVGLVLVRRGLVGIGVGLVTV